ncbi:MAG: deoxyribodipyrimidine photo-lyase [Methylacidiphilales bacterium]|nr:deoxyribodipyrimidine photo-lyase [Candidatus Methylacidiphilales bacterium]
MKKNVVIYWCRRDFRVFDNPALFYACKYAHDHQMLFLPIFILEDYMVNAHADEQCGYPSRFVIGTFVSQFANKFKRFIVLIGKATHVIKLLVAQYNCIIFVNDDIYPDFNTQIKKLRESNIPIHVCVDALTIMPETRTLNGLYYSIFTPFKNKVWQEFCSATIIQSPKLSATTYFEEPLDSVFKQCEPNKILNQCSQSRLLKVGDQSYNLDTVLSLPKQYNLFYHNDDDALRWLKKYISNSIDVYHEKRDFLGKSYTSKLSIALAWGLLSSRIIINELRLKFQSDFKYPVTSELGAQIFITELIWREFYRYLHLHYPQLHTAPFQEKFRTMKWLSGDEAHSRFVAWIQGLTGYPIVDAAMHELAQTGTMHNRSRMIVSSILTKNLGIDWRWGQEYFRAMLLDLDESSNTGGWQWGASVGADPKPIRIFNPLLQANKFDPNQQYLRAYLPQSYFDSPPTPIIEHSQARIMALQRYKKII